MDVGGQHHLQVLSEPLSGLSLRPFRAGRKGPLFECGVRSGVESCYEVESMDIGPDQRRLAEPAGGLLRRRKAELGSNRALLDHVERVCRYLGALEVPRVTPWESRPLTRLWRPARAHVAVSRMFRSPPPPLQGGLRHWRLVSRVLPWADVPARRWRAKCPNLVS